MERRPAWPRFQLRRFPRAAILLAGPSFRGHAEDWRARLRHCQKHARPRRPHALRTSENLARPQHWVSRLRRKNRERIRRGEGVHLFGIRHEQGVWSAHQIEVKIRGQAGSTLLIIDRGNGEGQSHPSRFQPRTTHPFLGALCTSPFGFSRSPLLLVLAGRAVSTPRQLARSPHLYGQAAGCRLATVPGFISLSWAAASRRFVFEAGIGATHLNWRTDPGTDRRNCARRIAYDRCGLGWSSPCRTARTPGNIAAELHQMLHGAGSSRLTFSSAIRSADL